MTEMMRFRIIRLKRRKEAEQEGEKQVGCGQTDPVSAVTQIAERARLCLRISGSPAVKVSCVPPAPRIEKRRGPGGRESCVREKSARFPERSPGGASTRLRGN